MCASPSPFLGFDFFKLDLKFQRDYRAHLSQYPQHLSSYNFASLFAWEKLYHYSLTFLPQAFESETVIISAISDNGDPKNAKKRHILQPIGQFPAFLQEKLIDEAVKLDYPLKIYAVSTLFIESYPQFCSHFEDRLERDLEDYVYNTSDLARLHGSRYERKRNLIYQAENLYPWQTEPLTKKTLQLCLDYLPKKWMNDSSDPESLENELTALHSIKDNFDQLGLHGVYISVDEKPAAFSVFDHFEDETDLVLFEKAAKEFKGLYQIINKETAKAIMEEGKPLIDRAEDLGLEGLRKAKLSYHPKELIPYHILTFKK